MRARVLTPHQRQELDEHLRARIPDAGQRAEALRRIGIAYQWASLELLRGDDIRKEWREENRKFRAHFSKMAEQAKALRSALEWDAPKAQEISWKSLSAALELLEASAAEEADSLRPARSRPVENAWRNSLIAVVHGVYPAGAKRGEHLRETVRIVLEALAVAQVLPDDADEVTKPNVLKVIIERAVKLPIDPGLRAFLRSAT